MIWSDKWGIDGKEGWMIYGAGKALVHVDFESEKAKIVSFVPIKSQKNYRLFSGCIRYGEKIICLPGWAERIYIYHLESDTWTDIAIESKGTGSIYAIINYYLEGSRLWCYSGGYKEIYVIDLEKEVMEEVFQFPIANSVLVGTAARMNANIYIIENGDDIVNLISFDMKEKIFSKHISQIKGKVLGVTEAEGVFCVWNDRNEIYCYEYGEFRKIFTYDYSITLLVLHNGNVYIFTNETEDICKLGLDDLRVDKIYRGAMIDKIERYILCTPYLLAYMKEDCFAVYSFIDERIWEIRNDEIKQLDIQIPMEDLLKVSETEPLDDRLKFEREIFFERMKEESVIDRSKTEIGQKIYESTL